MAELTEIENIRKAKRKKKRRKRLISFLLVVALVLIVFSNQEYFTPTAISSAVQDGVSNFQSGAGYPMNLVNGVPQTLTAGSNCLHIATSTLLETYNLKGKLLDDQTHGMTTPYLQTDGRFTLCYDSDGNAFRLCSKTGQVYRSTAQSKILAGAVNEKGQVAIATTSTRYTSQVDVYDYAGTNIFTWYSSSDYVTSIAFEGKYLAVAAIRAEEKALTTIVYVLKLGSDQEVSSVKFSNELPVRLSLSGKSTCLVTDQCYRCISRSGTVRTEVLFSEMGLLSMDNEIDSRFALATGSNNSPSMITVKVLTRAGKELCTIKPERSIFGVHTGTTNTAVLTEDSLLIYDGSGNLVDTKLFATGSSGMVGCGNYVFIQLSDSVECVKI